MAALHENIKSNRVTQEPLWRLSDMSEGETLDRTQMILEEYITELKDSGYYF